MRFGDQAMKRFFIAKIMPAGQKCLCNPIASGKASWSPPLALLFNQKEATG